MQTLPILFSPYGRLRPQPFTLAVAGVYLAGTASHWLTTPDIIAGNGLWLFAAVQALLIWIWFALHAKRLGDAGRGPALAAAAGVLYALSVVLLVIIAAGFFNSSAGEIPDAGTSGAWGLLLLVSVVAALRGSPNYDLTWLIVAILTVMAFVPIGTALAVTCWAATRPSAAYRS